jgi:hypothetical protein
MWAVGGVLPDGQQQNQEESENRIRQGQESVPRELLIQMPYYHARHKSDNPSFDNEEYLIKDSKDTGLLKPSAIKPAISTNAQNLVLKKPGTLSTADPAGLKAFLENLLEP